MTNLFRKKDKMFSQCQYKLYRAMHNLHFITSINYLVYLDWLPQYLIFLFTFLAEKSSSMFIYFILHIAGY